MRSAWTLALLLLLLPPSALGHGPVQNAGIEDFLTSSSITVILAAGALAGIFAAVSIFRKRKTGKQKMFLFLGIIIPVLLATAYTAGGTIYLNLISESGGPVHWHTDFEIWKCGEMVDLKDPEGLLNRVGSSVLHEHGDDRIHIEGVVVELEEIELGSFFQEAGGQLTEDGLILPTEEGLVRMVNGEECAGAPAELQGFLLRVTNPDAGRKGGFTFAQQKLEDIPEYMPASYSNVPPGDCLILEFDVPKERTNRLCETYRLAMEKGELRES